MADTAKTSITKHSEELVLTGKPVLVQNNLGIFYGYLEKSDTRNGTALLRDGYKLSLDRHITFSQYLDFLNGELLNRLAVSPSRDYGAGENIDEDDLPDVSNAIPTEILINEDVFNEHKRDLSITDYASEGVFMVQHRTSTHENSDYLQTSTPLVSLTGVSAIVEISSADVIYPAISELLEEWFEPMAPQMDLMYEDISALMTFFFIDGNVMRALKHPMNTAGNRGLSPEVNFSYTLDELENSRTYAYIVDVVSEKARRSMDNESSDSSPSHAALKYLYCITSQLPALVINSEQRVAMYKQKAQYEQTH